MRDLGNERAEVVARLQQFNFEPVNAEGWAPTGSRPWDRILQEITSSNVFLLLVGERYGFIPKNGPMAEAGKSVTHLEYLEARRAGLPILPFFKDLAYDADRESDDARLRDSFRTEVADWEGGQVIGRFDLARDLCDAVGRSLVELLSEEFQNRIRKRAAEADAAAEAMPDDAPEQEPDLPPALIHQVRSRAAVLFAGAGVSLDAGYPAAAAWGEFLMQRIRQQIGDYDVPATADNVRRIAGDLELVAGRAALLQAVRRLMTPPQMVDVTAGHRTAVRLFDRIITSNFDNMFEAASQQDQRGHAVVQSTIAGPLPDGRCIIKMHGSLYEPDTMILTEEQANLTTTARQGLCDAILGLFSGHPVVVIGSSLRDPTTANLFSRAVGPLSGYYVDRALSPAALLNARRWNLQPIRATAAGFFRALEASLGSAIG
jgi:hypothetical protein